MTITYLLIPLAVCGGEESNHMENHSLDSRLIGGLKMSELSSVPDNSMQKQDTHSFTHSFETMTKWVTLTTTKAFSYDFYFL